MTQRLVDHVHRTSPDLLVIATDEPGKRPLICDSLLQQYPELRIIAVAPHKNYSVFYWATLDIHSDDIEPSEKASSARCAAWRKARVSAAGGIEMRDKTMFHSGSLSECETKRNGRAAAFAGRFPGPTRQPENVRIRKEAGSRETAAVNISLVSHFNSPRCAYSRFPPRCAPALRMPSSEGSMSSE